MRLNPFNRRGKAKAVAPVFAVADLGGGEAEITLYGDVLEESPRDWFTGEESGGLYISAESFNKELESIKGASHVTIRLNSGGGDLYTGIAIHNALKALPARKTVRIEGLAASAASVIACAGDEVVAMPSSVFMVHSGYSFLFGWYSPEDIEAVKAQMDSSFKAMCNVYEAKTCRPREEVEEMVAAETWLVGGEIVDAGFADVYEADEAEDEDGEAVPTSDPAPEETDEGELMVAGVLHDVSRYRNVPDFAARVRIPKPTAAMAAAAISKEPPKAAEKKGETPMDVNQLREQYPDLVAEVQAQAAKAERERIAAIDEIAAGIPAGMVADAKYGNPRTAGELAVEALKADRKLAADYLAQAEDDADNSGADAVEAEPAPSDEKTDEEEQAEAEEEVKAMAKLFANYKKGVR